MKKYKFINEDYLKKEWEIGVKNLNFIRRMCCLNP